MSDAIRRILVAVDASPLSLKAVEAAVSVAARLEAEVEALFVEDINVVRLVSHPYVHTISLNAARRLATDDEVIEKALQLQMVAAHRALDRALAQSGAKGSFLVRRGRVAAELLEAAHGFDLVCLGWSGRAEIGSGVRMGSVARAVAEASPCPVLVLRGSGAAKVAVVWDGSERAQRVLAIAAMLAGDAPVGLLMPRTGSRHGALESDGRTRAEALGAKVVRLHL